MVHLEFYRILFVSVGILFVFSNLCSITPYTLLTFSPSVPKL